LDKFAEKTAGSGPVVLAITGMKCGGCVGAVKRVLTRVPGVSGVEIDLDAGRAMVAGTAHPRDLVAAVQGAGYGAHS
jgi:copper chaperone CopZ